MKTINLKTLLLCAVVLLTPIFLQAQYGIYTGQQLDHTYLTIENILEEDNPQNGLGYIISTTTYDAPSTTPLTGEITRTDENGNLVWVNQYLTTQGPAEHRFNHIEKFDFNGQVEYLVVGSLIDGSSRTTLMAAIIDDNGVVLESREIISTAYDHLVGIKGIVVSDETFAIIALESEGFTDADAKNIVVMKLDQTLNLMNSMTVSSPTASNDYDMATDIVEGFNSDQFFIIGTSNKNAAGSVPVQPCAFAASVELPGNTVIWSHNYSTALGYHWDAAADGYFDGEKLFVLGNSSIIHYYNLIELDGNTGSVNNEIQYSDVTYGNDFNHYGYELKPSLSGDNALVISGWKSLYSSDAVRPFLLEVDPVNSTINWHWKYDGYNNEQLSLNENDWLDLTAGGQFPYYYNDMMTYMPNSDGYAMLSAFKEGKESIFLWYGTNASGDVNEECGRDSVDADSIVWTFHYNDPVSPVTDNTQEEIHDFLIENAIVYNESRCEWEFNKNGVINSKQDVVGNTYNVYPNPATNSLYISGENVAYITLTDMFGREIVKKEASTRTYYNIDVSGIKSGIYLVNIVTTGGDIVTEKVNIIK